MKRYRALLKPGCEQDAAVLEIETCGGTDIESSSDGSITFLADEDDIDDIPAIKSMPSIASIVDACDDR